MILDHEFRLVGFKTAIYLHSILRKSFALSLQGLIYLLDNTSIWTIIGTFITIGGSIYRNKTLHTSLPFPT